MGEAPDPREQEDCPGGEVCDRACDQHGVDLATLRGIVRMAALTVMDEVGAPVEHRTALATAIAAKASLRLRDRVETLLATPVPEDPPAAARAEMTKAYALKVTREYAEMGVSMGDMASVIWDLLELLDPDYTDLPETGASPIGDED